MRAEAGCPGAWMLASVQAPPPLGWERPQGEQGRVWPITSLGTCVKDALADSPLPTGCC